MLDLGGGRGSAHCGMQFVGLRLLRHRLSGVFAVAGSEGLKCGVLALIPFGVFSHFFAKEVPNTSQALKAASHGVYFGC